jgi:hypothetical protein
MASPAQSDCVQQSGSGGLPIVARMPVEFLSDAEAAAYGRYDGGPSREDLDRVFFLDDADRELVDRAAGSTIGSGSRCS